MKRALRIPLLAAGLWAGLAMSSAWAASSEEATRAVTAAYEDILGRKPDESGMRTYRSKMVDDGWSEQDVRKALRKSVENRAGDVEKIIKTAYRDILGRDPDKEGFAHYKRMMLEKGWSEKDVRDSLRKSDEARGKKK